VNREVVAEDVRWFINNEVSKYGSDEALITSGPSLGLASRLPLNHKGDWTLGRCGEQPF
jgi:hypothetical protein